MKKILIAIIVLAVLAAGSLTAFFIVMNNEKQKENKKIETSQDYSLFSFDSNNVDRVEISCQDGEYSIVKNESNLWQLENSDEFIVGQSTVQNIYTIMSYLTAEKDYGEATDEAKEMFGLDDPTVISIHSGSIQCTLYLGDPDPTNTYYYAMTDSKSKIYAISAEYGEQLKTNRLMLKDQNLTSYGITDISSIKVIRDGKTAFEVNYDPDTTLWSLSEEYSDYESDTSAISTMVAYLVRLEALEMLDENLQDLSKYGFDKPYAELDITGFDGKTHKYLFSYYGQNSNTYVHVLFKDNNQVAAFNAGDLSLIKKSPKDYIVSNIFHNSIFEISEINYSYEDINCTVSVDKDNNKYSLDNGDKNVKNADMTDDFTNFFDSIRYLDFKDVDISASPELSDPVMTIEITLKEDKSKLKLQFSEADEDSFYVFKNDEFSGFIVEKSDVIGQNSITGFYDKLERKSG